MHQKHVWGLCGSISVLTETSTVIASPSVAGVGGSEALLSVFCSGNITRHTLIVSVFSKLVKVCRNLSVAAAIWFFKIIFFVFSLFQSLTRWFDDFSADVFALAFSFFGLWRPYCYPSWGETVKSVPHSSTLTLGMFVCSAKGWGKYAKTIQFVFLCE